MSEFKDNLEDYKLALEQEFEKLSQLDDPVAIAEGWRKYLIPSQAKFALELKGLALSADSESVRLSALKFIHGLLTQDTGDADPDVLKALLVDLHANNIELRGGGDEDIA